MNIQSTRTIERKIAIKRILKTANLILDHEYKLLIENSGEESDGSYLESFVDDFDKGLCVKIKKHIEKFSNGMLENYMDMEFFRFSPFDNYMICEDTEEE